MLDDYNHRWRIIRVAVHGIYVFLKVTFYEIPKFLIITLPWEILKETKRGIVRMYKAIPPIKEWPRIVKDAVVGMAKGIKKFLIALGRAIKATPKAIYNGGKYLAKQGKKLAIKTWRGIKALPGLMKIGLQKTWSGIKAIASWVKDLLLKYPPLPPTGAKILVFSPSSIPSSPPSSISSATSPSQTSSPASKPSSAASSSTFPNYCGQD